MAQLIVRGVREAGLYAVIAMYGSIAEYAEAVWGASPHLARRVEEWFEDQ